MPIFEYRCVECGEVIEVIEKEAKSEDVCDLCGSPAKWIPSVVAQMLFIGRSGEGWASPSVDATISRGFKDAINRGEGTIEQVPGRFQ